MICVETQRAIIALHQTTDLSDGEIAKHLHVNPGSVYWIVHRGTVSCREKKTNKNDYPDRRKKPVRCACGRFVYPPIPCMACRVEENRP